MTCKQVQFVRRDRHIGDKAITGLCRNGMLLCCTAAIVHNPIQGKLKTCGAQPYLTWFSIDLSHLHCR